MEEQGSSADRTQHQHKILSSADVREMMAKHGVIGNLLHAEESEVEQWPRPELLRTDRSELPLPLNFDPAEFGIKVER